MRVAYRDARALWPTHRTPCNRDGRDLISAAVACGELIPLHP
jgi:hypothetical protein